MAFIVNHFVIAVHHSLQSQGVPIVSFNSSPSVTLDTYFVIRLFDECSIVLQEHHHQISFTIYILFYGWFRVFFGPPGTGFSRRDHGDLRLFSAVWSGCFLSDRFTLSVHYFIHILKYYRIYRFQFNMLCVGSIDLPTYAEIFFSLILDGI